AGKTRQHLSANQEMVGKGLANVLAGVSQGYAVSGSFSRTAVAYDAGAKTGFTAIVSGMIVGLTLVFFTDLLFYIPLATLAAVIIVAVAGMIQFRPLIHAWKVNPHDGLVALVVFLGTLLFAPHLEWGIIIGISLSIALYIFRTMRPHFAELALDSDGTYRDAQRLGLETSATVALFRFDGDLYFANASYLERELLNAVADKPDLKVLVLDLVGIDQIDATGEEMLTHMAERLNEAGIRFVITRAKFAVIDMLKRSGLYDKIGSENFFRKRDVALAEIKKKYGSEIDITHLEDNIPIE
ncbi:MAG: SulP family inorganic anion transporter, partial [Acidimicrobiales bacterium]